MAIAVLDEQILGGVGNQLRERCFHALQIVGVDKSKTIMADQFLGGIAENARGSRADIPNVRLGVEQFDDVGTFLDQGPKTLLAAVHVFLLARVARDKRADAVGRSRPWDHTDLSWMR